jgi:hypothetical protein
MDFSVVPIAILSLIIFEGVMDVPLRNVNIMESFFLLHLAVYSILVTASKQHDRQVSIAEVGKSWSVDN